MIDPFPDTPMNECWMNENPLVREDLETVAASTAIPWAELYGRRVLVTGATGLIGSLLVKALLYHADMAGRRMTVVPLYRSPEKLQAVLGHLEPLRRAGLLSPVQGDVCATLPETAAADYIIHTAAVTTSAVMLNRPVDTLLTTVEGTHRILELARGCGAVSCLYLSSMEVYGRLGHELAVETDLGYVDLAAPRSSYPVGKRLAENLCTAYAHQYGVRAVCVRPTMVFGPGCSPQENRVYAQFARSVLQGKDIVLHTQGLSKRDYLYTADAVLGILGVLLKGAAGTAYNISNQADYVSIRELAETFASFNPACRVVVDEDPELKKKYAADVKINLDNSRLDALCPFPRTPLRTQVARLLEYMKTFQSPES